MVTVDGLQRHRGVELYGSVRPVPNLRLLGGATYMDGRQTRTQDGANDGRRAIGVPELQANLYAEYGLGFLPGATVTGRYLYTSSSRVFADFDDTIPDWTRVDLGGRYNFDLSGVETTARVNVENVFDKSHYLSAVNSTLVLDAGADVRRFPQRKVLSRECQAPCEHSLGCSIATSGSLSRDS